MSSKPVILDKSLSKVIKVDKSMSRVKMDKSVSRVFKMDKSVTDSTFDTRMTEILGEVGDNLKTCSAPVELHSKETILKTQISAPSYFQCLAENELPPFERPVKEPRPRMLCGTNALITDSEVIEMVAVTESEPVNGLRMFLGPMLINKNLVKNYELAEREFLLTFLEETVDYAAQRDFTSTKLSTLMNIYLTVHEYFKWYYWSAPSTLWDYFMELVIRHTVEDTPRGGEIFDINESYDILTHFHTIYMVNLPLIHIICFGVTLIKAEWPFTSRK